VLQVGLALAVCGGALAWSWRVMWDNSHPLLAAARGLQARAPSDRLAAVDAVSGLGFRYSGEALHSLIPALGDPDAGVRAATAKAVGLVGNYAVRSETAADTAAVADAWTSLLGLLKDQEIEVRSAAATSLGIIAGSSPAGSGRNSGRAGKKAEPALDVKTAADGIAALLDDRDAGVRLTAISAMGSLAPKVSGDPPKSLLAAMEDESAINRTAAATALAGYRSGLDPLIPILLGHIEHDELQVRIACTDALGRIRPPAVSSAVAPALIAAIGNRDREVRLHLVTLLGRLAPDARLATPALIAVIKEPIESDQRVVDRTAYATFSGPAYAAIQALGRLAPRTESAGAAIAVLAEVVRSGHPQRRASAAQALGEFGPAAAPAVPALIAFLKEAAASKVPTRDGDAAAHALGRIAPSTPTAGDAVAALAAALSSTERLTREAAITALLPFGPKAAPAIPAIRALKDKDPETRVREAASEAMDKLEAGSK
jgi:HEAT repeat protein